MFVINLTCLKCGTTHPMTPTSYICPACEKGSTAMDTDIGILDVQYDYLAAQEALLRGKEINSSRSDVFRYIPLLPVKQPADVPHAGGTPLLNAPRLASRLGLKSLYIKDETRNPTRCLKDRATVIAMTMTRELGVTDFYCASAGNAAISLASYCGHQGLNCHVFVPQEASQTRLNWLRRFGARIQISAGNYDQAFDEAESAGAKYGWYSRNCAYNPFLVEGKKTVALEIGEQLGWQAPDLVVSPVGDGCTLGAIGKGFRELSFLGLTDRLPRLLGIQSEVIQPLVHRYHEQSITPDEGTTAAASMAVRRPRNALRLLKELRASEGTMLAVSDSQIAVALKLLAEEAGVIAEFTSSATLAGLIKQAEAESLAGKTAVLVITGGRLDSDF
ncbi:threonine synthase [Brevibacillus sp. SIMBA_040]|uniref:threonine synthase n=1 Tax=unclassified Brevibacillus TaxID=2684853 RepID=UPI00397CB114